MVKKAKNCSKEKCGKSVSQVDFGEIFFFLKNLISNHPYESINFYIARFLSF